MLRRGGSPWKVPTRGLFYVEQKVVSNEIFSQTSNLEREVTRYFASLRSPIRDSFNNNYFL